ISWVACGSTGERVFELDWTMASRSEAAGGRSPEVAQPPSNPSRPAKSRKARLIRRAFFFPGPSDDGTRMRIASNESGGEILGNHLPVDRRPAVFQIRRAVVAMVDVVRMLPHVAGEQRHMALAYRCVGIGGCHDLQTAACILHQPGPARAEKTARCLVELCLQRLETTESFQRLTDLPARALTPG